MTRDKQLLLHTCCGPCFTAVNEKLADDFEVQVFWYNPNIEPEAEHDKRLGELNKYLAIIEQTPTKANYDYTAENILWHKFIAGLENEPEGGQRCTKCFEFRLKKLVETAKKLNLSATTTLTVSPYKNAKAINEIGLKLAQTTMKPESPHTPEAIQSAGRFLEFDFKKDDGYRRSIELSKKFDIYRQKYCGCQYSQKTQR